MSIDKEIEDLRKEIELEELRLKLARLKRESENFHSKEGHYMVNNQMRYYGYPSGVPGHPDVFIDNRQSMINNRQPMINK